VFISVHWWFVKIDPSTALRITILFVFVSKFGFQGVNELFTGIGVLKYWKKLRKIFKIYVDGMSIA
jgi:hypothetical protein